jgi:hypothetical protein
MALQPEDRTEDLVERTPARSGFVGKQQPRKKDRGDCRMVVEFPFYFTKEFLDAKGKEHGTHFTDAVDYLRLVKTSFEKGQLSFHDLMAMVIDHGDGAIRVEAAK